VGAAFRWAFAGEGAWQIHRCADEAATRDAIKARTVYGAVVVTAQGPELLTASTASPLVAQQAPSGIQVRTVDVLAAPQADPRGVGRDGASAMWPWAPS
jgi:hypothetical protein